MPYLNAVDPEKADGPVAAIYESLVESIGTVPVSMQMLSASPGLLESMATTREYLGRRSGISPLLSALIRFLTATVLDLPPCVAAAAVTLGKLGLTGQQIEAIAANPAHAPLEEKEGWMLAFVMTVLGSPERLGPGHVDNLRRHDWSDADIVDALFISTRMMGTGTMMKALGFIEPEGRE